MLIAEWICCWSGSRPKSFQIILLSIITDGSSVGVIVDLGPFTTEYQQRLDNVIGQCVVNFHELKTVKEKFDAKVDEFQKEVEETKKELTNKTRTFKDKENQLKAQIDAVDKQLTLKDGNSCMIQ